MHYQQRRSSRPPPLFELRVQAGLARLAAGKPKGLPLPPPHLWPRLCNHIESFLLAENLPPTLDHISMVADTFSQLAALAQTGKPIVYKKRNTISLLFDVFALQSEMSIDGPDELVLGYTQSMMGFLLFNPSPKDIGMIGLGGGSLTKYCYRYLPGAAITVAEIDQRVIELRNQFRIPPDDERLRVLCMDGIDLVRQSDSRFDVLMVDGFDRKGQPAQLCSQSFYDDCRRALSPNGIMVVNLLDDPGQAQIYIDRIDRAFGGKLIVIDGLDSLNKVVFACRGSALDVGDNMLRSQISELEQRHPVVLSLTAESIVRQRRIAAALDATERKTASWGH